MNYAINKNKISSSFSENKKKGLKSKNNLKYQLQYPFFYNYGNLKEQKNYSSKLVIDKQLFARTMST